MNKTLLAVGVVGVLTCCVPTMSVGAVYLDDEPTTYLDDVQPRTAGMIQDYEVIVSNSNGYLCLNGSTISDRKMKSIGLTNIEVQRSSDNEHWTKEKNLTDMLASSANEKYINNYTTSVLGGYYYRITCDHYAKESGMFGSSQSVSNTSNSVWID